MRVLGIGQALIIGVLVGERRGPYKGQKRIQNMGTQMLDAPRVFILSTWLDSDAVEPRLRKLLRALKGMGEAGVESFGWRNLWRGVLARILRMVDGGATGGRVGRHICKSTA